MIKRQSFGSGVFCLPSLFNALRWNTYRTFPFASSSLAQTLHLLIKPDSLVAIYLVRYVIFYPINERKP